MEFLIQEGKFIHICFDPFPVISRFIDVRMIRDLIITVVTAI